MQRINTLISLFKVSKVILLVSEFSVALASKLFFSACSCLINVGVGVTPAIMGGLVLGVVVTGVVAAGDVEVGELPAVVLLLNCVLGR